MGIFTETATCASFHGYTATFTDHEWLSKYRDSQHSKDAEPPLTGAHGYALRFIKVHFEYVLLISALHSTRSYMATNEL